jgi:telomere length regulation protein
LPIPSRSFLLDILDRLSTGYSIDEVYWAVWSTLGQGEAGLSEEKGGNENGRGAQELLWEEATRSVVGIPAKCANAVGKWKSEAWAGEGPDGLVSKYVLQENRLSHARSLRSTRRYFDRMIHRLEGLMYELSLSPSSGKSHLPLKPSLG